MIDNLDVLRSPFLCFFSGVYAGVTVPRQFPSNFELKKEKSSNQHKKKYIKERRLIDCESNLLKGRSRLISCQLATI
jgi:hypothetical protein